MDLYVCRRDFSVANEEWRWLEAAGYAFSRLSPDARIEWIVANVDREKLLKLFVEQDPDDISEHGRLRS